MVLLDRRSKKVLKQVVKLFMTGIDPDDKMVHAKLPKMKLREIQSALSYLHGNSLITYEIIETRPVQTFIIRNVSYEAGYMKEFQWLAFRNSILFPAAVSLIVSLIFHSVTN